MADDLQRPAWPDDEPRKCYDCGKTRDDVRLRINLGDKARLLCAPCFSERTGVRP